MIGNHDCPLCKSAGVYLERLAHGWFFCNACGRCFLLKDDGTLARATDSNHAPTRPMPPQT